MCRSSISLYEIMQFNSVFIKKDKVAHVHATRLNCLYDKNGCMSKTPFHIAFAVEVQTESRRQTKDRRQLIMLISN